METILSLIDRWAEKLEKRPLRLYPGIAGSLLFLGVAGLILTLAPGQIKTGSDQAVTARTFPSLTAFIMLGGALLNLGKEGLRLLRREELPFIEINLRRGIKSLAVLGILILYAWLMPLLGFIPASMIFSLLMLLYFRETSWRAYAVTGAAALGIGVIFQYLLHVRLP